MGRFQQVILRVLDFDLDFKEVEGLKEGLGQYYKLEQETDLCSINLVVFKKK